MSEEVSKRAFRMWDTNSPEQKKRILLFVLGASLGFGSHYLFPVESIPSMKRFYMAEIQADPIKYVDKMIHCIPYETKMDMISNPHTTFPVRLHYMLKPVYHLDILSRKYVVQPAKLGNHLMPPALYTAVKEKEEYYCEKNGVKYSEVASIRDSAYKLMQYNTRVLVRIFCDRHGISLSETPYYGKYLDKRPVEIEYRNALRALLDSGVLSSKDS